MCFDNTLELIKGVLGKRTIGIEIVAPETDKTTNLDKFRRFIIYKKQVI
ncbi:hypothetical protein OVS_00195 [Mycoplasma ovis str. Michigan]|uniref:Uncharacterized protein n=1 Tax=Mycoplasma ovis str. Michigan TaxID=1415773 RepID=A0ABN4BP14_9MOLU|nr:hypothetical protein OVS_00195 [Mycoplasma ovis str. Michigan]